MLVVIDKSFKSSNNVEKATIVKSFKYGAAKEVDPMQLELVISDLIDLVKDKDLNVKKNSLEALNAVVHNHPLALKNDIAQLQKLSIAETVLRPELITEVDLGPFKHKQDDGIPIRKAAYSLIDSLVEKLSNRLELSHVIEVAIKGLDDAAEECLILSLHILGRLINLTPTLILSFIDQIIESFEK